METLSLVRNSNAVRVSNAVAAGTTTITTTGTNVDASNAETVTFYILWGNITTGASLTVKAQQSDDDGSADDYTDLAGSSVAVADDQDNKVTIVEIVRPLKKNVRLSIARATQNTTIDGVLCVCSRLRKGPATQDTTISGTPRVLISPAEGTA